MWFGTRHGINRYDGYDFTAYAHDPDDPFSISNNWITAMFEDSKGNLWFGTQDGLNKLERKKIYSFDSDDKKFDVYRHDPHDINSLSSNAITAICEDEAGILWIGTTNGLNSLDSDNNIFTHFRFSPNDALSLSGNLISSVIEDTDGELWVGTSDGGLSRFDKGRRSVDHFQTLPARLAYTYAPEVLGMLDSIRTARNAIAEITRVGDQQDSSQNFEIAKRTNVLVRSSGEGAGEMVDYGWIEYSGAVLWKMSTDKARHSGGHGKNRMQLGLIELLPGRYTLRYKSDGSHAYGKWNRLPPNEPQYWGIQLFALTADEQEFFTSRIENLHTPPTISNNNVTALLEDESGLIWLGTANGLNSFEKNSKRFRHYLDNTGPHDSKDSGTGIPVRTMCQDQKGLLWIGTTSGLLKFDRHTEEFTAFKHDPAISTSLSTNVVLSTYADKSGALWVGTMLGGINKYDPQKNRFRKFTYNAFHPNGLTNRLVYSFFEDDLDRIWLGTGDGVNIFDPAKGTFVPVEGLNPDMDRVRGNVFSIYDDAKHEFWFGTNGNGLFRIGNDRHEQASNDQAFKNSELRQYLFDPANPNSISSNSVWCIFEDSSGTLWFGTDRGLNRYNRQTDTFKRFLHDENDSTSLSGDWVRTIFEDRANVLWIGTESGGLNRFDKHREKFIPYVNTPGDSTSLSHNSVTSVFEDAEGNLWVATYGGGLNRFDRETGIFRWFTKKDGLANHVIYGILPDEHQKLWLSTNNGLSCFDLHTETFKNYDVDDGLQSNEFNSCAYFKRRNGEMLFGGVNGFNLFHPDSIRDNPHRPPVMITSVKILDKTMEVEDKASQRLELTHKDNFISFEFVALDYTNPQKNQYAYKLEGFDEDWVNCGSRRYATYTNLDPGEYVFWVKAANNDGVWSEEASAVHLIVQPPFWQTWWFYILSFASIAGAIFYFHHYRVNMKIKQVMAIERVRKKAAADFHDELGHKLTKISLFCEIIRRSLTGQPVDIAEYLVRIGNISKSLYDGMRDFLWTLDPEKDSFYEMAIRLKDFGDEFFDKTGIAFKVKGIGDELRTVNLTMDEKRHITLIFKEGMNNILKHARGKNVTLEFIRTTSEVTVSLQDDGVGFRKSNGFSGNGLDNIIARAQKIQGKLDISSDWGKGTKLALMTKSHTNM